MDGDRGEGDRAGRDAAACWSGCPWVALGRLPLPYFLRFISLFFGDARGEQTLGGDGRHVRYANVAVQVDKGAVADLALATDDKAFYCECV